MVWGRGADAHAALHCCCCVEARFGQMHRDISMAGYWLSSTLQEEGEVQWAAFFPDCTHEARR